MADALHYLLAAQTPDPFFGLAAWSRIEMCEVTVAEVRSDDDTVEVTLTEYAAGSRLRRRSFVTDSARPGLVAQLEGWHAIRLPLLLTVDDSGDAQLSGPDTALAGFREFRERV